jgi:hypothetical protein
VRNNICFSNPPAYGTQVLIFWQRGTGSVAKRQSICLVCERSWVPSPPDRKGRKGGRKEGRNKKEERRKEGRKEGKEKEKKKERKLGERCLHCSLSLKPNFPPRTVLPFFYTT